MDSPSLLSSNRVATFNESERWPAYSRANDRIQADLRWVATLKGDQFLLRSFKKPVARCYRQLCVSRHYASLRFAPSFSNDIQVRNRGKVRCRKITDL
jgi:hypothetical protein